MSSSLVLIKDFVIMSVDYNFETQTIIPENRDKVFSFFSKAENLEILTPKWLNFRIITPLPIEMKEGALIDYKLKLFGIPFHWQTRITVWDPPNRFVDEQIKGPYSKWNHEHLFVPEGNRTQMRDHVSYAIPVFSSLLHKLFIRKNVERIFRYRQEKITGVFGETS